MKPMNHKQCHVQSALSKLVTVVPGITQYNPITPHYYAFNTILMVTRAVSTGIPSNGGHGCRPARRCLPVAVFPTKVLDTVVVDSHIQRIVLATEKTTVTQQVSHRPIKCQSRSRSQRGTEVNRSRHDDSPLLKPIGIQIAMKPSSYATFYGQRHRPMYVETVHQISLFHIESNLDRLGLSSPTHGQRSQQQSGQITLQSVLINKPKFLKATHIQK